MSDSFKPPKNNLNEIELQLQRDIQQQPQVYIPPPHPLLPRTLLPSEPPIQAQPIPFLQIPNSLLPEFEGTQQTSDQSPYVSKSSFPDRYQLGTSLKQLFQDSKLVYVRDPQQYSINQKKGTFNANTCDIRKLIQKRKSIIDRTEKNPLLVDSLLPSSFYPGRGLLFQSRFQSGNLSLAAQVSDQQYNLLLQNDINSKGHIQWFFFSVSNTRADHTVKFNIVNFAKADSLFNQGMKILTHSKKHQQISGFGWRRTGQNIMYYPNGINRERLKDFRSFYTLTFTYTFEYSEDTVFFAYSLPYTYSQLQLLLDSYERDPIKQNYIHRKSLTRTISGNMCDYLTITKQGTVEQIRAKRGAVISARVHPGQTVGSWMMHGVLQFLTSEDPEAQLLREKYVIKLVPMINPDGVINGNYRCSLIGADLNRRWKSPLNMLHPVIFSMKRLVKAMSLKYDIDLICDLHGHSRKQNIFMYGCNILQAPHACKLFPYVVSKISPLFSYNYSRFGVQKSKQSTLRVSLFKELKLPNIYTLQASFCGCDQGEFQSLHFTSTQLMSMGRDLCRSLLVLSQNPSLVKQPTSNRDERLITEEFVEIEGGIQMISVQHLLAEMKADQQILHTGEGGDSSSSGSDSQPSEDNFQAEQLKQYIPIIVKKKKTKPIPKKKAPPIQKPLYLIKKKPGSRKKCPKCGEEEGLNHVCKAPAPSPPKRPAIGIRTYYNISGRRVHDQATQTPTEFYPKIAEIRAEMSSNRENPEEEVQQMEFSQVQEERVLV